MNFFKRQDEARRASRRLVVLFGLAVVIVVASVDLVVFLLMRQGEAHAHGYMPPLGEWLAMHPRMVIGTTLVVLAITAINALKAYDIIYAMTNGGPANKTQLLSTWMYFLTYNYNQVGLGTAIAVILFSLTLVFAIPYIRFMTRKT